MSNSSTMSAPTKRRTHSKARTGCFTCKTRRKKCDEGKPACMRCSSSGRICDGYSPTNTFIEYQTPEAKMSSSRPTHTATSANKIKYPLSLHPGVATSGAEYFHSFCQRTAPTLSGYYNNSKWLDLAVFLGHQHPSVFWAAAACGAAHRQFAAGITPTAFSYFKESRRLHNLAVESLQNTTDNAPLLISRLLLGIFACFRDDMEDSTKQMQVFVEITLGSRLIMTQSTEHLYSVRPTQSAFQFQADRIQQKAHQVLGHFVPCWSEIPETFRSAKEACEFLFGQIDELLFLWASPCRSQTQEKHVMHIFQWGVAYAKTTQADPAFDDPQLWRIFNTTRNLIYLLLHIVLFRSQDHFIYGDEESLRLNFVRVCGLIDELIASEDQSAACTFSLDTAIGSPLPCSPKGIVTSTKTRHLVKSCFEGDKEALWKLLDVYNVAERFSAIEEHAIALACPQMDTTVSSGWLAITCSIENCSLSLRYCRPGRDQGEVLWTREQWKISSSKLL